MTKFLKNAKIILGSKKGLTIIELITTIVVGSIITMILMQLLVLSVNARTQLELENRMLNESYYIVEQIRLNISLLEPQEVEIVETPDTITIYFRHLYDYTADGNNVIVPDYSNPFTDVLVLDKVNEVITYYTEETNSTVQLNESNIFITSNSNMELLSVSTCDFGVVTVCDKAIVKLSLEISVQLNDGSRLLPQTYVSTLLVYPAKNN